MTYRNDDPIAPLRERGLAGERRSVACSQDPRDTANAASVKKEGKAPAVAAWVHIGGADRSEGVVLTPADARRFAAALLDAADEADGTVPLVFLPESAR